MSDLLAVYLHGERAGTLERRSQARLRFSYSDAWIEEEGAPISLGLPLREEAYEHEDCAPFFEGLLPEGEFLKAISRTLQVSARNPFQLLAEIGGECAGAISVGPPEARCPGEAKSLPAGWRSASWASISTISPTGPCWGRSMRRTASGSPSPVPRTRSASSSRRVESASAGGTR